MKNDRKPNLKRNQKLPLKTIVMNGIPYPYELTKSRRKSISIQIRPEETIQVKAPSRVSLKEIEGFLRQKEDWIVKTLQRMKEVQSKIPVRQFETGERFHLSGKEYFLQVDENPERKRSHILLTEDRIVITVPAGTTPEARKNLLRNWYREQARAILTARTERFSEILGVTWSDIRIKEQKSRWGSCSSKGNLNFNWHIIMAPETIADYLVIHELCHLKHMNHSPEFWDCVGSLYPDYKKARKWLKENGNFLRNW